MLDDSPFWCRFAYGRARAPTRRCSGRARRRRRIWKDTGINTHRQHVRIVQSHHRILCNNSNCRRSSLSFPLLTLPRFLSLAEPVSPHQLSLSCLSHRFKISLSLPPLALSALPIPSPPPPPPLLASVPVTLPHLLTCLLFFSFNPPFPSIYLSLSLSPTPTQSFLSLSHSLLCFPSTPSLLFCCCALACSSLLSLLRSSSSPPISPR